MICIVIGALGTTYCRGVQRHINPLADCGLIADMQKTAIFEMTLYNEKNDVIFGMVQVTSFILD